MAGEGEDSMMDCEDSGDWTYSFFADGQSTDSPSTIFVTPSGPCDPRDNPIAETGVQAIASGSSTAQSPESCGAQAKRRATEKLREKDLNISKGTGKRVRDPNWSDAEKLLLLMLKLEALENAEKSWFCFVSKQLDQRHGIKRLETPCQQQWDSLYKPYKAIKTLHDLQLKSRSEEHPVLFWDMDESTRMALKYLPGMFPKDWYGLMEDIIFFQAPVKKTQDIKTNHRGESIPEPSTSTRALDSSTIPPNQPLVSSDALRQSNVKLLLDEELMSRIVLLVNKQIEQVLMPELLRRQEDNEQKHRENLRAREEEHQRRLQAMDSEHSRRLLAIEAEHSRRLQAIQAEHSRRLQAIEAEHLRRLQAIQAKLL